MPVTTIDSTEGQATTTTVFEESYKSWLQAKANQICRGLRSLNRHQLKMLAITTANIVAPATITVACVVN